jgi:hypothetical protein
MGAGGANETNVNGSNAAYKWAAVPKSGSAVTIKTGAQTDNGSINTPDITNVYYGVGSSTGQYAGQYKITVVYTAIALP